MEKFKSWLLNNEAKKDEINSMIGKYACHKEGDDVIFVNVDDPKDSFSRPLTTGQYKLLRQRFNNSYRRGGQVTNRYKIDPALITRDRINYNIDTILGLRTSDTSDLGLSLNKKYEHDVANNLDDVLGDQVPKTDVSQSGQRYYATGTGDDSRKSDILAVHDRPDYNSDKKKPTKDDSSFYVEVKLNKLGSFLNPLFTWTEDEGFKSTHKYGFDGTEPGAGDSSAEDSGSPDRDQAIEDKALLTATVDKKTSRKNKLEELMDSVAGKQMEIYCSDVKQKIEEYNLSSDKPIKVKDIKFPDTLQNVVPLIQRKLNPSQDGDDRSIIENYVRGLNVRKLKQNRGRLKKGDGSLYVVDGQLVSGGDIAEFLGIITKYYLDKGCAYIQIGPLGEDDKGNLYILDKKYDPLNLQARNDIPEFKSAFDKCKFSVSWEFSGNHLYLAGTIRFPDNMIKRSGISMDKDFSAKNIDTKGEFFDKKEQSQDSQEESAKTVNDSMIDEFEVSKTASNRYEVEIKDKIREFLDSQEDPRYSSLDVQHYEESDSKYHSDVYVTNPRNGKQVWIEVKLNKYANLGGLSFKYRDGKWTCTTASEENPLNRFYLDLLETHGKKFIDFCKDYLGTEEIRLPTDMTDDLLDAWKRSGSIEDTENETQFITEKIPLDGFGSVISRFYMTAKEEPVYYIQVADDLYIIDSNCNPLDLYTKDGNPLKSISDAYRIGRIQFRVKAMNVSGERYFSVVSDVKILSDKEHFDKEYSCSFDTPEKWPVTGKAEQMISEKLDETKFLTNLPKDTARDIIFNTKSDNTNAISNDKWDALLKDDSLNWCALVTKDENVAIADLLDDYPFKDYHYINEVQNFKKGYGKVLIEEIVKKYKKVWLMADPSAKESLVDYYRQFDFEEIVIRKSVWGKEAHFFCTKDCDCDKLEVYIVENYSKKEDLKEADKDIGGDVWDKADEVEGTKVWIDDIREAPEGFKWFKTVKDFIDWCYQRQDFSDVSLIDTDHDAGDYQQFGGDYIRIFDYLDRCGVKNVTVHIHSANPVGATNIRKIIGRNKENGWKEVRNSYNKE